MSFFRSSKLEPDTQGFYPVCTASDLSNEQIQTAQIAGETIVVTRLQGQLRAFAAACPHASGDLSKSSIYRGRIDCPEHGYRFDVLSGRVLWPPDEVCRLKQYEIVESEGLIKVRPVRPALP